ncbi:hypothetical protein D187_005248 [Cystobacter fuscus DSM 2262]|uniref:SnoaL-like domain-containing protein n=1 Tax=Cystobacter fuscus (strain ATCC 25194 / DSM 2262 / NBRC 100088 / M29) TaxID=1242864 RepID=S9PIJ1_CYSF2|nr:nuclear transport factor 2 family protein [Cystobacter fuscus]EPX64115.1 hypothetical protein D187_005248 [Cystobacter fuscus DSM 2262]
MLEFRAAVEAGDFAALGDLLADDVVFRSPVAFRPYEGRAIVAAILRGVGRVFTHFRYVRERGPRRPPPRRALHDRDALALPVAAPSRRG